MNHLVFKQIFILDKTFVTLVAWIGLFPCVYSLVVYQSFLIDKAIVTLAALVWYLPSEQCLVVTFKITFNSERLFLIHA